MRSFGFPLLLVGALLSGWAQGCSRNSPVVEAPPASVTAQAGSFSVTMDDGQRMVTTLGTLKNASAACFENIVVEVKYFDAKNVLVDSVTQMLFSVLVPPSQEVAFRVREAAARPKEAYVSQTVRVVSAEIRGNRGARQQQGSSFWTDTLVSWAPMLLLIAVWIFFMRRMSRKDAPQQRSVALVEQQVALIEAQNRILERLAAAAEKRAL